MKFYNADDCLRKSNQHWEMAGCARRDNDDKDAERHTRLAREWHEKAKDDGCYEKDAPK